MDKWIKKLTGIVIGSALVVLLNGKAYAEVDDALPEGPATEIVEEAPEEIAAAVESREAPAPVVDAAPAAAEAAPAEEAAAGEAAASAEIVETVEETAPAEGEAEKQEAPELAPEESAEPAALSESAVEEAPVAEALEEAEAAGLAEEAAAPAVVTVEVPGKESRSVDKGGVKTPSITVGGTVFDGSADVTSGWEVDHGWRYSAADKSLTLVDFDGSDLALKIQGKELNIFTAGLNRLKSIFSDVSVHLVGSGILLVDEVELEGEDHSVTIQPDADIYGEDTEGGTAVFLKQEDGSYLLVNGTTPGILDESYTIPSGVDLVVPEGSSLLLPVVTHITETDPETHEKTDRGYSTGNVDETSYGDPHNIDVETTCGALTIADGASLTVEDGAAIRLSDVAVGHENFSSTLTADGRLTLDGTISEGIVMLGSTAALTGDGTFLESDVFANCSSIDAIGLASSHLTLSPDDSHIGKLTVSEGASVNSGTLEINSVTKAEDASWATLSLIGRGGTSVNQVSISDAVSGVDLEVRMGLLVLGKDCALDGCTIVCDDGEDTYNARIYDLPGELGAQDLPLIVHPDDAAGILAERPSDAEIPVKVLMITGNIEGVMYPWETASLLKTCGVDPDTTGAVPGTATEADLYALYLAPIEGQSYGDRSRCILELHRIDSEGNLSCEFRGIGDAYGVTPSGSPADLDLSNVYELRVLVYYIPTGGMGGSVTTATHTSFTGTGILGGSGAGSIKAGSSKTILTGKPASTPETPETPEKPETPETPEAPETAAAEAPIIWSETSETETGWRLDFYRDGKKTAAPAVPVEVYMDYTLPDGWDGRTLFVVFRNGDGTLTAFEARYDAVNGRLVFKSNMDGEFLVVAFDYDGKYFTGDFYEKLAQLDEIKAWIG